MPEAKVKKMLEKTMGKKKASKKLKELGYKHGGKVEYAGGGKMKYGGGGKVK